MVGVDHLPDDSTTELPGLRAVTPSSGGGAPADSSPTDVAMVGLLLVLLPVLLPAVLLAVLPAAGMLSPAATLPVAKSSSLSCNPLVPNHIAQCSGSFEHNMFLLYI